MKKMLIGFILGGIIFGSAVYAVSYNASDITYIKDGVETNVNEALNNLYEQNLDGELIQATGNVIPKGVKKAYVFITQLSTYNYQTISINSPIIINNKNTYYQSIYIGGIAAGCLKIHELELTGEEGTISVSFSGGEGSVTSNGVVYYLK